MTKLEVYEAICQHVDNGEMPCYITNRFGMVECRYRAGDKKCLVGGFIPDELYDRELEGKNIANTPEYEEFILNLCPEMTIHD